MRTETGSRLIDISHDEVLREFAVYGTPEAVADRLLEPPERVLASMRLFADRVMPRLG